MKLFSVVFNQSFSQRFTINESRINCVFVVKIYQFGLYGGKN